MSSTIDTEMSNEEIGHFNDEGPSTRADNGENDHQLAGFGSGISEIEEEEEEDEEEEERLSDIFETNTSGVPLATIKEEVTGSLFSFDFHNSGDVVYVAIGKSEDTSMDALRWTMSHSVEPISTLVFLIHIFPEIKHIPTPLGMMPIDQVNPTQKESHLAQERGKRRDYLQKFINVCSNSKVKVDTILIESNMEAKAILDLIPILNIRKLILGTSKRSTRYRRVTGTAAQILKGVPQYCEVKIVCEGKEMVDLVADISSPRASSTTSPYSIPHQELEPVVNVNNTTFYCGSCFKPKVGN